MLPRSKFCLFTIIPWVFSSKTFGSFSINMHYAQAFHVSCLNQLVLLRGLLTHLFKYWMLKLTLLLLWMISTCLLLILWKILSAALKNASKSAPLGKSPCNELTVTPISAWEASWSTLGCLSESFKLVLVLRKFYIWFVIYFFHPWQVQLCILFSWMIREQMVAI